MKKIVLCLAVFFLCACSKTGGGDTGAVQDARFKNETAGLSVLGIKMRDSQERVKRSILGRVSDMDVDEMIIVRGHNVGPTRFNEIRFLFESFGGVSSLQKVELYAQLEKEEARYFVYYWNKVFGDKYKLTSYSIDVDNIYCDQFYEIDNSTSVSVRCKEVEFISYYDCEIAFVDWEANSKLYEKLDNEWLENYCDSIMKNKYTFTEY